MNVLINLRSLVLGEAIHGLLKDDTENGYHQINDFRPEALRFSPDVVIVDKWCLNNELRSCLPEAKIILLDTGLPQAEVVSLILTYKLHGVINVNEDSILMKKAIKVVQKDQLWIDSTVLKALVNKAGSMGSAGAISTISRREQEIIDLVTLGKKNKDIAAQLFLSEQTVKAHLTSIFKKFNVSSRVHLMSLLMKQSR